MAIKLASDIIEATTFLRGKYSKRNKAFSQLRSFYNAEFWAGTPQITGIKLVYNLLANVVDRFTDFMSQHPDWRVIPAGIDPDSVKMADKQEKFLYSQWELNNINIAQQWQANLQSMLGSFGFEVRPIPDKQRKFENPEKYLNVSVLDPGSVYAMPKSDGIRDLDFVIVEAYDYTKARDLYVPSQRQDHRRFRTNLIRYYDQERIVVLENNKEILRIEHGMGFIPLILGQNRVKPHFVEGIGDLDQAVGLNQYLNEIISWQADILEYAANPVTIIKGHKGDKALPTGPGATWYGDEGFSASFLTWAGQAPEAERMIQRIIQAIQDMTNLSDPIFGREVPSGTSGSAVKTLMSGIQATMLRKQVAMGEAYVSTNEVMFKMIERLFPNQDINVRGTKKGNAFIETFKGREINGNYRNQAIWPPGILDQPSRINVEIQKLNSRLQSRQTTMENVGILSPLDELKIMRKEEEQAIRDELIRSGQLNPQQKELETAATQLQKGQFNEGGAAPEQQLIETIQGIDKIKGDVFFGGTDGETFIIVISEPKDKATILNKLPEQFKGKITFKTFDDAQGDDLTPIVEQEEAA